MADEQTVEQMIREAELRKAVADAERAEAQARKARYDAREAEAESRPGGHSPADERSGYPATLAAYQAMLRRSTEIARAIEGHFPPGEETRIMIVDSVDFCGPDVQAIQVSAQLDFWLDELTTWNAALDRALEVTDKQGRASLLAVAGGVAAAVGAAGELAGLATDVVGFFRPGYDIKGRSVNLTNTALQAVVAGRLDKQKCAVFLPAFFRLESAERSPVIARLNECIRRKDRLKQQVAALRGQGSRPRGPEAASGTSGDIRGPAGEVEALCKKAEQVIGQFAETNEALTSPPKGGGYPPLAIAAMRDCLDTMKITHLLYLGVVSSGGDMVLGQGPLNSGKAGFLGAGVFSYILARCSGEIVAADTIAAHSNLRYELGQNQLLGLEPD